MGMFGNLFNTSKKKVQKESGCCSLELEEISDEKTEATSEAESDGGCCGSTAREDASRIKTHT